MGATIAQRATAITPIPGRDTKSQRRWLIEMYGRRNDAAHAGFSTSEDLDVEEMLVLVKTVVQWAAWHWTTMHHEDEQPCMSIDEVVSRHIEPLLTRNQTRAGTTARRRRTRPGTLDNP